MPKKPQKPVLAPFAPSALVASAIIEITIKTVENRLGIPESFSLPFSLAAGATIETLGNMHDRLIEELEYTTIDNLPEEVPIEIAKSVTPEIIAEAKALVETEFAKRLNAEAVLLERARRHPTGVIKSWMIT